MKEMIEDTTRKAARLCKAVWPSSLKGKWALKLIWVVPVAILIYILCVNFLPFGGSLSYHIDVGGKDTGGKAEILGPFDRISDKLIADDISYRELESKLVYFTVSEPRLKYVDQVEVRVRFYDNFPDSGELVMGARNNESWSYGWKNLYLTFYEALKSLPLVAENGSISVYAATEGIDADFESVDDFMQNPPTGSVIARSDKGLDVNQMASLEDSQAINVSRLMTEAAVIPLKNDMDEGGSFESDTSLLGEHSFYFLKTDGALELLIGKRDLNRYAGADYLEVMIYSLDGTLKAMATIIDDGDLTQSNSLGPQQYWPMKITDLEAGTYRLVIEPMSAYNDFIITHLGLNQSKLAAAERISLAGASYIGGEPQPMEVWCYLFSCSEIKFHTSSNASLQTVAVSGGSYNRSIQIEAADTEYETGTLEPGIYRIATEKGDITVETPKGLLALSEDSLFLPTSSSNREQDGGLIIDTVLRGPHTLWTYVEDGSLELEVTKQDLNWYEGSDELAIEVYSYDGVPAGGVDIPDDGDETSNRVLGQLQSGSLELQGLEPGTYRIELNAGNDLLISGLELNQDKLVLDDSFYSVGLNTDYFKNGLPVDVVALYGRNIKESELRFRAVHADGLQQIEIIGEGSCTEVYVNETGSWFTASTEPGDYQLIVTRQDMVIEFEGYMSFTPDSFFFPQRCEVVAFRQELSWLKENTDYVVIDCGDYIAPVEDDGWLVAEAEWPIEELFIKDDALNFCFSVPHLIHTGEQARTIPLDWIEIELSILPLWDR